MNSSAYWRRLPHKLAERLLGQVREGDVQAIERYARQHPSQADEVRELCLTMEILESMKPKTAAKSIDTVREFAPGERLGDYEIVREISRGGMGIVYEAVQTALSRRVAVKVLTRRFAESPVQITRFEREARSAAALHHTNIVPVFERGEAEGVHYFAMQFIEGASLADAVLEPLADLREFQTVAEIGRQAADALAHAHAQGVIHRDVKPGNLLLDRQGNVWLTDFGLAKDMRLDDLTAPGDAVGTLRYMAPEQLDGSCDSRTDIYGLGAVLYELTTGQPPFEQRSKAELVANIVRGEFPSPCKQNPHVPRDLEKIILKAMATNVQERYASAADFADDLWRFNRQLPIRATSSSTLGQCIKWSRRNPLKAALSAVCGSLVVLLILVGGIGYLRTDAALKQQLREQEKVQAAQQQAQLERQRCEENLQLALNALNKMAEAVAFGDTSGRPHRPGLPEDSLRQSENLSQILGALLDFYATFIRHNHDRPELACEIAAACRRTGDIHAQLGRHDESLQSYQRALELLGELSLDDPDLALQSAILHGAVGHALQRRGDLDAADKSYAQSRSLLQQIQKENPQSLQLRFELARTHDRLGQWHHAQGDIDRWRHESETAVADLEQLVVEHPDCVDYRFALAMAYRNTPPFHPTSVGRSPYLSQDKSISILSALVSEYSENNQYVFELSRAYAQVHLWRPHGHRHQSPTRAELNSARNRLRKAVAITRRLCIERACVPDYANELVGQLANLAFAHEAAASYDEADRLYLRAIERGVSLLGAFPDEPTYLDNVSMAEFYYGRCRFEQGDFDTAAKMVDRSISRRLEYLRAFPDHPRANGQLRDQMALLDKIHAARRNKS